MTFNTTSLPLRQALQGKRLLYRPPLRPVGNELVRHVLVTPEVDALLDGHILYGIFPDVSSETLIASFSAGWMITFSQQRTKKKPQIEKITGADEVWSLCPRKPPPGWRLFGRIYERGVFLVLRAFDKHWLAKNNYAIASSWTIDEWKELFGDRKPYTAPTPELCLGGLIKDVDEE